MHLIESEELKEEAKAKERTIRDLKKLKSKKQIPLSEFNKKYSELAGREMELEKQAEKELIKSKKEKKDAVNKTVSLKEKTKKIIKK